MLGTRSSSFCRNSAEKHACEQANFHRKVKKHMSFFLRGVRVPHRKNTADQPAVTVTDVRSVTIPTVMHIGAPATPVVSVGDTVQVGTLIAEGSGAFSAPIHASVSGKVTKIASILLSSGKSVPAITIESDGEMTPCESLCPPVVNSREDLLNAIRNSGTVGLGGAGFPTHVKFNVDSSRIEALIINGAECEPYITSDSYTMTERVGDMEFALRAIQKHYGIARIIIGIESNKKSAIAAMRELAARLEGTEVRVLPQIYPQGGEKVLIYHTVKRVVPTGKLPIDVGCVVCNCTTIAEIGKYLQTGMPLVSKCVTVDGGAVAEPRNLILPIGTSLEDAFNLCGGFKLSPHKVLYGGPMMGIAVPSLGVPVIKNTNAVLALCEREAKLPEATACIRCGTCTRACPFGLAPAEIMLAYQKKDTALLERLSVDTCMLCGCCSFDCPANRPLVQTNNLSKQLLREERAKEASKNG